MTAGEDALSLAELRVLARVDGGFCHSLSRSALSSCDRKVADALAERKVLRVEKRRGRLPKRFVVTNHGIHSWQTFLMFGDLDREVFELRRERARARSAS